MRAAHVGALTAACCCLAAAMAAAQTEASADPSAFLVRASFKSSLLVSRFPDDPVLFPDRDTATGLWRFRLEPVSHPSDQVTVETAFETRLRAFSSVTSGAGVLPIDTPPPFRIRPLDWRLASSPNAEWRGEVDRVALHVSVGAANLTFGRQAIGWGRGVLFSAVDLFSPFTPLEADREWRRGVDAVRADVKLADRVSVDAVAAFGPDVDHSALAARLRGYAGTVDAELVAGRRAQDAFVGGTSSAAVGDVEVHGELAVFRTPATPGSVVFADERSIVKAVAGGSYRFSLGTGLLAYLEYHYSGFGAASPEGILPLLADPAFQERYIQGDTQILERHVLAVLASYEVSPEVSVAGQWLQSPTDGSGILVPSGTFTFGDRISLALNGYLPYGAVPAGTVFRSLYGASPLGVFLQLRLYR